VARHAAGPLQEATAATVARRTAARLEAGGYARRVRVLGEVWLVPTGRGLAMAAGDDGKPFELWRPVEFKLSHAAAVARLRLWLADQHPDTLWENERQIRRRLAAADAQAAQRLGFRIADGGLHWPDGRAVGVECELSMKK